MTSSSTQAPPLVRLNNARPLLERAADHAWENRVVFNPACALVTDAGELAAIVSGLPFDAAAKKRLRAEKALCFLLYRAQGSKTSEYDYTRSSMGLAVLSADLRLLARHTEPVILPDKEYEDLGVEDGRITRVGDRYYMFYCAYRSHPGGNEIRLAVASSKDFFHWEKHGLLNGDFNNLHNKNSMLLEGKVNGELVLLHRPMEGAHPMSIHWATAKDVLGPWKTQGLLMAPEPNPAFKDTWIGGGAPPLLLSDGRHLVIFHIGNRKEDGVREYDLGLAVADFRKPGKIVKRIDPWVRPDSPAETLGDASLGVNNVMFICGAYFYEGNLYFPYAGADSVVLGGMVKKSDLEKFLKT